MFFPKGCESKISDDIYSALKKGKDCIDFKSLLFQAEINNNFWRLLQYIWAWKSQKNKFLSFFLYLHSFFYVIPEIAQFRGFQSTVWSRPAMIKIKTFKGKCHATKWRNWNLIYFTYFSMYFKDGRVCACTIKQDMRIRDDIPKIWKV